jgi:hypothetical protein
VRSSVWGDLLDGREFFVFAPLSLWSSDVFTALFIMVIIY